MLLVADYLDNAQMAECRAAAARDEPARQNLLALAAMWRSQADLHCGTVLAAQAMFKQTPSARH